MKQAEDRRAEYSEEASNPNQVALEEKLNKIKELYDRDIITKSEYDSMRQKLFDDYMR
jgi:hypothetical protein